VVRVAPGAHPPETALTEVYNVPPPGFGARGADIDGNGVVWCRWPADIWGASIGAKCKGPLKRTDGDGRSLPGGVVIPPVSGPGIRGDRREQRRVELLHVVDQHDTFGLGRNVPLSTGNLNDGLIAFATDAWSSCVLPYPLGFYAKGLDGRIDDANGG